MLIILLDIGIGYRKVIDAPELLISVQTQAIISGPFDCGNNEPLFVGIRLTIGREAIHDAVRANSWNSHQNYRTY